jgi:hypothetical protein
MSIGRNDPCPCGSGKKYKKCHGASHRAAAPSNESARASALKAVDVALAQRLARFTRARYGPDWLQYSLESAGLLDDGSLSDADMPIVFPWLVYFNSHTPSGLTPAQEWRDHQRHRISSDERLLLDAYEMAWLSLWEVVEVESGVGSRLTDVLTREERFVRDVSSTSTLQRFDTLLAIVLTVDDVSFFGGAHAQPLPPRFAETVTREARRMCRVRTRPVSAEKLRDPELQLDLLVLWRDVVGDMANQPPPVLLNTDGDPIALTTDSFALLAPRDEVVHRLTEVPGVQEPEQEGNDAVFVVTKPGNPMNRSWENTIIGRMVLSRTRLSIETNSTRRADALRSLVEARLAGLVRFSLRTEENASHMMADALAAPRVGPVQERLTAEEEVAIREFRERHMRDWLDDSIPALEGLTPRDAARSSRARPKLETLLKEFEQHEARLPEQQRIDLRSLREPLGFS